MLFPSSSSKSLSGRGTSFSSGHNGDHPTSGDMWLAGATECSVELPKQGDVSDKGKKEPRHGGYRPRLRPFSAPRQFPLTNGARSLSTKKGTPGLDERSDRTRNRTGRPWHREPKRNKKATNDCFLAMLVFHQSMLSSNTLQSMFSSFYPVRSTRVHQWSVIRDSDHERASHRPSDTTPGAPPKSQMKLPLCNIQDKLCSWTVWGDH